MDSLLLDCFRYTAVTATACVSARGDHAGLLSNHAAVGDLQHTWRFVQTSLEHLAQAEFPVAIMDV